MLHFQEFWNEIFPSVKVGGGTFAPPCPLMTLQIKSLTSDRIVQPDMMAHFVKYRAFLVFFFHEVFFLFLLNYHTFKVS